MYGWGELKWCIPLATHVCDDCVKEKRSTDKNELLKKKVMQNSNVARIILVPFLYMSGGNLRMENPHLHQIGWAGLICICERVGGVINTGTKKGDWGCNTHKKMGEKEMMHERRTTKKELVMIWGGF